MGSLSTASFTLSHFFWVLDESVVNSFWDSLDVNQDGTLTKKELVVGLTVLTSGTPEEKLKKVCIVLYSPILCFYL